MKKITNAKETELSDEQLDAVSGGFLKEYFDMIIADAVAKVNDGWPPPNTVAPGHCPGQNA